MNKFAIAAASLALISLASCGNKAAGDAAAADTDSAAVAAAEAPATEAPAAGTVIDLADDNAFRPDTKVATPTVLDFNATWCGPCKMLTPVFHAAAEKHTDVLFYSVDIDKLPQTANAFAVDAVPTVIILTPDGDMKTFVGTQDLLPAEKFEEIVSAL